jgi:hypothetical protein
MEILDKKTISESGIINCKVEDENKEQVTGISLYRF